MMTLEQSPIKTLAAYRSGHVIRDVDGRCETDGIPVYRIDFGKQRGVKNVCDICIEKAS